MVLGGRTALDAFGRTLDKHFEVKRSATVGFEDGTDKQISVLQRCIAVKSDRCPSTGVKRHWISISADAKHVPLMVQGLGLENASSAKTPRVKRTPESEAVRLASDLLTGPQITLFRSHVMRASYLAQDRPDLQETVRLLACSMAAPRQGDLVDLKRLTRYLKGHPCAQLRWFCSEYPLSAFKGRCPFTDCPGDSLHIFSDADWAGDPTSRKSATGFVAMRAGGCLRSASTTQSIIGLSSCESEFYALCRASATGLGVQSNLLDLGISVDVFVWSDASAARAVASRRGLGKVRHLHTRFLWLQDTVACKAIALRTISGKCNPADAFTKALTQSELQSHMGRLGLYYV